MQILIISNRGNSLYTIWPLWARREARLSRFNFILRKKNNTTGLAKNK